MRGSSRVLQRRARARVQADPRIQDDHKNTALGIVVSFRKFQADRLQIAQQLVVASRRTDGPPLFNIPDGGGHTPVLLAAAFGDATMLDFMISHPESDITARNNAGTPCLPHAAGGGVVSTRAAVRCSVWCYQGSKCSTRGCMRGVRSHGDRQRRFRRGVDCERRAQVKAVTCACCALSTCTGRWCASTARGSIGRS